MPDLKISQLPVASTPLAGTELVPIVQGGTTDQTTVQAIMTSTVPSGTANGVLYLNGSKVATSGSALVFDGSNLGLGATPSASWSGQVAFQVGPYNAVSGSASGLGLANNAVFTTSGFGAKYLANGAASFLYQNIGAFTFFTAPSGTAGNAISFTQAMTLDASGNLLVGGTSVYVATMTSYGTSSRSAGLGLRNSAGTAAGGIFTYAAGSGGGSTDVIVESTGYLGFYAGGATERARITSTGNVVAGGSVALATTATDGFLYVPTCAGTPTGTPTAITGMAPIVVDTTNNKMYFYSGGAWRDAGP